MESDLPRCAVTSKYMTKRLTKAELKNSCKNTWNMHGRGDIIRSQMFFSVYTKVTRGNHQKTGSPSNLVWSQSALNLQKTCKKELLPQKRDIFIQFREKSHCWTLVAFENEASVRDPEIDPPFPSSTLKSLWVLIKFPTAFLRKKCECFNFI